MQRAAFLVTLGLGGVPMAAVSAMPRLTDRLRAIEHASGGRLGVAALDPASGRTFEYRGSERFAMCSTFKALAVGAALERVDRGDLSLRKRIAYRRADLLAYAPVTSLHVAQRFMTLGDLCAAATIESDNTAANLILRELGGPASVTRFARSIGDSATRLDRIEPALNTAIPGDPRDTTTPLAMAHSLHALTSGPVLSSRNRGRLNAWLAACRTGTDLLRAGLPADWHAGDKTGLGGATNRYGDSDTRNDIAVIWAPRRAPVFITAYLTRVTVSAPQRDAALAAVARAVVAEFFS
jgi:beta-lactamase class A